MKKLSKAQRMAVYIRARDYILKNTYDKHQFISICYLIAYKILNIASDDWYFDFTELQNKFPELKLFHPNPKSSWQDGAIWFLGDEKTHPQEERIFVLQLCIEMLK